MSAGVTFETRQAPLAAPHPLGGRHVLVAIHVRQARVPPGESQRSARRRQWQRPLAPPSVGRFAGSPGRRRCCGRARTAAAGVMQQQCGFCAAVSDLFRRMMCFSGSRRGSDQSYYHELDNDERLIVRPKVWFFATVFFYYPFRIFIFLFVFYSFVSAPPSPRQSSSVPLFFSPTIPQTRVSFSSLCPRHRTPTFLKFFFIIPRIARTHARAECTAYFAGTRRLLKEQRPATKRTKHKCRHTYPAPDTENRMQIQATFFCVFVLFFYSLFIAIIFQ